VTPPLSMLRFSTPAVRRGVQSDCEPPRSTIAARNALGRMSRHRQDWRAVRCTFIPEHNLARKENDPNARRAPFFTSSLCDLPFTLTSSSRSRTTMADPSRTQRSIRLKTSSASSSAASRAAAMSWAPGGPRRPENSCGIAPGPTRSPSTQPLQKSRSNESTALFDGTSAKKRHFWSSPQPARRRSKGQCSRSSRRDAGATPCNASTVSRVCSAAPRLRGSSAWSGPSSSSSQACPEVSR
jgi:hypothetical protein